MTRPVLVVAEVDQGRLTPSTLECVAEALDMVIGRSGHVHVVLPGANVACLAEELAAHGADRVSIVEHEALAEFSADGWLAALEPVLRDAKPMIILAPDSGYGRAWLPRLSARWRMPLATNCSRAKVIEDGYPEAYRFSHSGKMHERLIWARGTMVGFMMAPDVRGVGTPRSARHAEIETIVPVLDPSTFRDRTLRTLPADPRTVDLADAERIVSGGLGVGGQQGMDQLRRLAEALGATLGGTRVAADRGWLPPDRFIGTTGKIVNPKLYIAFGVSGAGQHIAGIGGSQIIVSVNIDGTAPMLKMADLGVIGDLHQIVPILLRKLEALAAGGRPAPDAAPETANLKLVASGS
ncbi:MAG: electron transfer flavoprotein subunit alpha/FixB family protein [Hyphomicrobium sp.]